MQLSVRSYLTAGVATLGAAAIIAAPITPVPHHLALGAPSISTVTADVKFTSVLTDLATAVNLVVDGFQGATDEAVNGVLGVAAALSSTSQSAIISTASIVKDVLDSLNSGADSIVEGFVNAANVFLPSPFDQALSDVVGGFLQGGTELTDLGWTLVDLVRDALNTVNTAGLQLLNAVINSSRNAEVAVVDGFQNALDSAASFDFGQAISDVVGGLQAGAGSLAFGAQSAASIVGSTASTLFSYAQQVVQALVAYPVAAAQAAYQGIKNALALFGIPLPVAANRPTAPAARAAAEPATAATTSRATTRSHSTATSGSDRVEPGRRSVAPSASAGHAHPDAKQSGTKDGSKHGTGSRRASRHSAA